MSDGLCILEHDPDKPAERWIGLLCRKHRQRLDEDTAEIGLLIVDMCRILDGGAPAENTPKTRRLKAADAPAPADLGLLSILDKRTWIAPVKPTTRGEWDTSEPMIPVLAVIGSWLLLVAEERPLTAPLPGSVLAQLDLLQRHHDWLAATMFIDDYVRELHEVVRHLRDVTNDHTHHRVATCDLPNDAGTGSALIIHKNRARTIIRLCGGAVLVENGEDVWRCKRCGSQWVTNQQKARFGIRGAA